MKNKQVFDYETQGSFLFRLGRAVYQRAESPLSPHTHGNCTEFVFLVKGCQTYQVNGNSYRIFGGEVFTAFPRDLHGTGGNPEEKAEFYYLIVDLEKVCKEGGFFQLESERTALLDRLSDHKYRVRRCSHGCMEICSRLLRLMEGEEPFLDSRIRCLLCALLIQLAEAPLQKKSQAVVWLPRVLRYIQDHIQENMELQTLAELIGLSMSSFQTGFLAGTGMPPGEYILRQKLEYCQRELTDTTKTITDIAFTYGFSSSQYFSTVFRRFCHISPSEYRQRRLIKEKEPL